MIDERALVDELAPHEVVSLRLDSALTVAVPSPSPAKVHWSAPNQLELRSGRRVVGRITGTQERIAVAELVLGGKVDERVLETLLPKDIGAFRKHVADRQVELTTLLQRGRELVERIERLVCAIYDVPDDLTDQVVEHAVRRAS